MTREEIEKSLRICVRKSGCAGCSFKTGTLSLPGCLDNLLSAVADMLEQDAPGWISVKDRLPDEEEDVLILVREIEHYGRHEEKRNVYRWIFTGWCVDGEWATTYCHGYKYIHDENEKSTHCEHTVTHWMPLPKTPKEAMTNDA